MGMSASQARLLTLTARLADNEFQSQMLNNSKQRLADQSAIANSEYVSALQNNNFTFSNYDNAGNEMLQSLTFNSLTAYSPFNNQYGLTNYAGQFLVSEDEAAIFEASGKDLKKYLLNHGLKYGTTYFDGLGAFTNEDYVEPYNYVGPAELENYYLDYADFDYNASMEKYNTLITTYAEYYNTFLDNAKPQVERFLTDTYGTEVDFGTGARTVSNMTSYMMDNPECVDAIYPCEDGGEPFRYLNLALKDGGFDLGTLDSVKEFQSNLSSTSTVPARDEYIEGGAYWYKSEDEMSWKFGTNAEGNKTATLYLNATDTEEGYKLVEIEEGYSSANGEWIRVVEANPYPTTSGENFDNISYSLKMGGITVVRTSWGTPIAGDGKFKNLGLSNRYAWDNDYQYSSYPDKYYNLAEGGSTIMDAFQQGAGKKLNVSLSVVSEKWDNQGISTIEFEIEKTDWEMEGDTMYAYEYLGPKAENYSNYDADNGMGNLEARAFMLTQCLTSACEDLKANPLKFAESVAGTTYAVPGYAEFRKAQKDLVEFMYKDSTKVLKEIRDGMDTEINPSELLDTDFVLSDFLKGYEFSDDYKQVVQGFIVNLVLDNNGEPKLCWIDDSDKSPTSDPDKKVQWYTNMFEQMMNGYAVLEDGLANSSEWIKKSITSGSVLFQVVNTDNEWETKSYNVCPNILTEDTSLEVSKAEAKYKRTMKDIEFKDKAFDNQLNNLETEHNSLEKEKETISKIIEKNAQRMFKYCM